MVKKGKLSVFFCTAHNVLLTLLPFIFIFLLIHNFSYFLSSSTTTFTLYIFSSTKKSTSYRPYNDPRLNFVFQHSCVNSETIYNHHHISIVFSPPSHFYCFLSTTTFLLFLLHHHHHHHISIVLFYCFVI